MIPLTNEERKLHREQKSVIYAKKEFNADDTKYYKVKDHCHYTGKYRGAAYDICNIRCKTPKKIRAVFHNSSTYDYHFIIKELAEEFEGQFKCLGENTEKYITFSVSIKKELDNGETSEYKLKFIDKILDLSQVDYQVLLINFLKGSTIINAQIVSLALITFQLRINY